MSGESDDSALEDLLALDMEWRLTVAFRIHCECAPYFVQRREALMPAVLRQARREDADPVDVFARFARGVHARHESGQPLTTTDPRPPHAAHLAAPEEGTRDE